ncbi:MAG TPA: hypothetical protein VFN05_02935, partial [Actinomycetes bacterium]|nr:hypothetical protein [Actinomycetes bacterium]
LALALLCRAQHRAVHEAGWQLPRAPDGRFTATPPDRRPRRPPGRHRRQPAGVYPRGRSPPPPDRPTDHRHRQPAISQRTLHPAASGPRP